jgi:hypothetical protein
MKNYKGQRFGYFLFATIILSLLVAWFSRYIQTGSFDIVQHFLLVDELEKFHGVRDDTVQRIGAMALYPPGAHWMAVIAGWFFGSSLVGITVITVASAFLVNVFIILLVGANSLTRVFLFIASFLVFSLTRSQIGWEVVNNFFYPQLVGDVVYLGVLLCVSKNKVSWKQTGLFLMAGLLAMWIQPLVAIHIFAAGCALMAFQLLMSCRDKTPIKTAAACLIVLAVGAAVIVFTNPGFKVMRQISANDGSLLFGYSSIMLVAFLCAAFGGWNLRRYWSGKAEYIDAVLACAVIAGFGLVIIQFALLKMHGDGSPYAIKKHMFIVFTLGIMNAVRVFASLVPIGDKTLKPGLIAPIFAGVASLFALKGFTTPVAPIVESLAFANHAVENNLPGYVPGNTVSDDGTLPIMANVMVSLTAFQHAFDAQAIAWQGGASIKEGSTYVMMRRTPRVSETCNLPDTKDVYVILKTDCLTKYTPGEVLSFTPDGIGWQYASNGWGGAEQWGSWTLGNLGGTITLSVPPGRYELVIDGRAYVTKQHPVQEIVVEVNGMDIATWNFDLDKPIASNSIIIPESLSQNGKLRIVLNAPDSVSPAQLGQSADARVLGIGVQALTVREFH